MGHITPTISQKVILLNDQKQVLLTYERSGWQLPGGRLEEGEELEEGLIREIQEELGIRVRPVKLQSAVLRTAFSGLKKLVLIYLVENLDDLKDIKIKEDEIDAVRWASFQELEQMNIIEEYKQELIKFFQTKF